MAKRLGKRAGPGGGPLAVTDRKALAVQALSFLAADPARLGAFLAQTGLDPLTLREAAADSRFLDAVLVHLGSDDALLLAFAAESGTRPEVVARAVAAASGPPAWDGS